MKHIFSLVRCCGCSCSSKAPSKTNFNYPGPVLVPGHKYPKMGGDHLYGRSDTHRCFPIYFFNPCFRVLMAWDKYHD